MFFNSKKTDKINQTPEVILKRQLDYMPEFYISNVEYKNAIESFEKQEYANVIISLIKLTEEEGHYFSEDFWNNVADAADQLRMNTEATYSRMQLERNRKDGIGVVPFGWTTIKIDDTHYMHRISDKLREEWALSRRQKDRIEDLINKNGIHLKSNGRNGFLYYVDNKKLAEIEYELGVNGLIVYFDAVKNWVWPIKETLTAEIIQKIKTDLIDWSKQTKNAIDLY
jgi:hypothetical protein